MGFTYGFQDGTLYGVTDVNGIVSNFTSAGVSTYSDLNGIAAALTGAGVTAAAESCQVVKNGDQLKISPGVAYFSDGAFVKVDASGVLLDGKRYVYFKRDSATGTGYPVSSDTAPGTNDIPLAEYTGGTVTDKRPRAVSKIQGFGSTQYQKKIVTLNLPTAADYVTVQTFTDIARDFRYVMAFDNEATGTKKWMAWGDMVTGKYWSATSDGSNWMTFGADQIDLYWYMDTDVRRLKVVKDGVNIKLQYKGKLMTLKAQLFFA